MEITPEIVEAKKSIIESSLKDFEEHIGKESAKKLRGMQIVFKSGTKKEEEIYKKLDERVEQAKKYFHTKHPSYNLDSHNTSMAFRNAYIAYNSDDLIKEGLLSKEYNVYDLEIEEIEEAMRN